jgi:hypothetical protein
LKVFHLKVLVDDPEIWISVERERDDPDAQAKYGSWIIGKFSLADAEELFKKLGEQLNRGYAVRAALGKDGKP